MGQNRAASGTSAVSPKRVNTATAQPFMGRPAYPKPGVQPIVDQMVAGQFPKKGQQPIVDQMVAAYGGPGGTGMPADIFTNAAHTNPPVLKLGDPGLVNVKTASHDPFGPGGSLAGGNRAQPEPLSGEPTSSHGGGGDFFSLLQRFMQLFGGQ